MTTFVNNTAGTYGDKIASVAKKLTRITKEEATELKSNRNLVISAKTDSQEKLRFLEGVGGSISNV